MRQRLLSNEKSLSTAELDDTAVTGTDEEDDDENDDDDDFDEDDDDESDNESAVRRTSMGDGDGDSVLSASARVCATRYAADPSAEVFGTASDQTEEISEENKSIVWFLVKQVRPGMDLSKVVLPTFILEPRSFLDKLTDYHYHNDFLSR